MTTALAGALQMVRLGFSVFPLRPGTKKGMFSKRSWKEYATDDPIEVAEMEFAFPGCNWGAWCKGFAVIDIDVADGKQGALQWANLDMLHEFPETREHLSPRGGRHVFYRMPEGVQCSNRAALGASIDLRGVGGYVLCPGSTFEGKPYTVASVAPIADAPPSLLALLAVREVAPSQRVEPSKHFDLTRAAQALEALPKTREACVGTDAETGWRDQWLAVGMALHFETGGSSDALELWDTWSAECESYAGSADVTKRWNSFGKDGSRAPTTFASIEARARRYGWAEPVAALFEDVSGDFQAVETVEPVIRDPQSPAGRGKTIVWPDRAMVEVIDENGNVTREPTGKIFGDSQENLLAHLTWTGSAVWFDMFHGKVFGCCPQFKINGPLTDDDYNRLRMDARVCGFKADKTDYFDMLSDIAHRRKRHPVLEYLDGLVWDGVPRLTKLFPHYTGAPDDVMTREAGVLLCVAAVRRVRKPGTKFDYMVILEGPQGSGKSSFARILSNGWYSENVTLGMDPKEIIEQTAAKWFVEVAELGGMNSAKGVEHIKAMISRTEDEARMAYGRNARVVPRQFVLIGTTNSHQYLTDPSGNRRIVPISAPKVLMKELAADVAQLWAEAVVAERGYGPLVLSADAAALQSLSHEVREATDPIRERLEARLSGVTQGYVKNDTLMNLLEITNVADKQRNYRSVNTAMEALGFKKARKRAGGQYLRVWARHWQGDDTSDLQEAVLPGLHPREVRDADVISFNRALNARNELLA